MTSICTGSLILGGAGLLAGKRAACHWRWRDMLPLFGVVPDASRVVRDGNIISGGGVTAGIDFALSLIAELRGEEAAQEIQLGLEYAPAPDLAPASVLAAFQARVAGRMSENRIRMERVAARVTARPKPIGSDNRSPRGFSAETQAQHRSKWSARFPPGWLLAAASTGFLAAPPLASSLEFPPQPMRESFDHDPCKQHHCWDRKARRVFDDLRAPG